MDSIDKDILKYMSRRDNYYELKDVVTKSLCVKESWQLLADFGEYYKQHPNAQEIDSDFKLWQRVVRHPEWKPDKASQQATLVDIVLGTTTPDRTSFLDSLYHLKGQALVQEQAEELSRGNLTLQEVADNIRTFTNKSTHDDDTVVNITLQDLSNQAKVGGYYWRLEDLNRSLGPLHKGDLIIVGKRPEVGGTSFLVSELTHMLEQTDGNAVIFNNEEAPDKVYSRLVSSAIGVDYRQLLSDPAKYQALYDKWLQPSRFDLVHDTSMTISSIHKQLEEREYDLIGINVLLKVGGTGAKEDHDKFQALGEECRRIAQNYGPVVAIVQADPSAEGVPYIPQDRIYKSKTALQGEADGLIMIGTDEDIRDTVRYIHVAKNKLPPAACTEMDKKHLKSEVQFDVGTGRFTSNVFSNHSRPSK